MTLTMREFILTLARINLQSFLIVRAVRKVKRKGAIVLCVHFVCVQWEERIVGRINKF